MAGDHASAYLSLSIDPRIWRLATRIQNCPHSAPCSTEAAVCCITWRLAMSLENLLFQDSHCGREQDQFEPESRKYLHLGLCRSRYECSFTLSVNRYEGPYLGTLGSFIGDICSP